jgi:predicted AlkP superfamily pyrophosphatase or phosphodiesterase
VTGTPLGQDIEVADWAAELAIYKGTRVILLVLDGCGPEFAQAEEMPALRELAAAGGLAPAGGLADLIASTGPGHATLLTGERPAVHGVLANRLYDDNGGIRLDVRAMVPSILDLAQAAGRSVRAAASDPDILLTVNAETAAWAWPDRAAVLALAEDSTGYLPDELTAEKVVKAVADGTDLIFAQLQDIDTAAHEAGLDSERSSTARRRANQAVARILKAARPDWQRTVLIVLSDHRMENVVSERPVELATALAGMARVMEDGSGALIEPRDMDASGAVCAATLDLPGIGGIARLTARHFAAWTTPGLVFGRGTPIRTRASHGNATTRPCLTVVGGGHPAVAPLARRLRRTPPPLHIWGSVVRRLLAF